MTPTLTVDCPIADLRYLGIANSVVNAFICNISDSDKPCIIESLTTIPRRELVNMLGVGEVSIDALLVVFEENNIPHTIITSKERRRIYLVNKIDSYQAQLRVLDGEHLNEKQAAGDLGEAVSELLLKLRTGQI